MIIWVWLNTEIWAAFPLIFKAKENATPDAAKSIDKITTFKKYFPLIKVGILTNCFGTNRDAKTPVKRKLIGEYNTTSKLLRINSSIEKPTPKKLRLIIQKLHPFLI